MYDSNFYATRHNDTIYSADKILSIVLQTFPFIKSAVDVGCGVGTFLSVLRTRGVEDVLGLDGPWVNLSMLEIDPAQFSSVDLLAPFKLLKKYDLAICLEVAEHLPVSSASDFIKYLGEASDIVLFSAAIPGQGGENHLNEAWQSYWVELFNNNGFTAYDIIRPKIWNDNSILYWYRQNSFVFARNHLISSAVPSMPINVVHPETFNSLKCRCDLLESNRGYFPQIRRILESVIK